LNFRYGLEWGLKKPGLAQSQLSLMRTEPGGCFYIDVCRWVGDTKRAGELTYF
jgi:hypothetical protein